SPCLPVKLMRAMQMRSAMGDAAAQSWLDLHARAFAGDPQAQHLFGRVCENGALRAPADRQRACFWYHRAALQGDVGARMAEERLLRCTRISCAALAEPALIHDGRWLIESGTVRSCFELRDDGTLSGHHMAGSDSCSGRWIYHSAARVLMLVLRAPGPALLT